MFILARLKIIYLSILLWIESHGSNSKSNSLIQLPIDNREAEYSKQNVKLRRGVQKITKWMREIGPDGRAKLIKNETNLLSAYPKNYTKNTLERLEEAKAIVKLNKGPVSESEDSMVDTFIKNQPKYKLLARRKELYKELKVSVNATRNAEIATALKQIKADLRQYE